MNNLSEVAYIQLFEVYNLVTYGPRMVVAMKARQQSLGKTVLKICSWVAAIALVICGPRALSVAFGPLNVSC